MSSIKDRIAEYFDTHINTVYNYRKIAEELGINPRDVAKNVNIYFGHRIGIDNIDKGRILPLDGFADPTNSFQTREKEHPPQVKTAHLKRDGRLPSLSDIEDDAGRY